MARKYELINDLYDQIIVDVTKDARAWQSFLRTACRNYKLRFDEQLTDKFTAHYFELKKIGKNIDKNNKQELWLRLINAETEDELDMLQQTGVKQIQDAVVVLHKMSADEKTRELAEMREKALHIEATEKSYARAEGEAVGLKKGRAEGRADLLEELLKQGIITEEQAKNYRS